MSSLHPVLYRSRGLKFRKMEAIKQIFFYFISFLFLFITEDLLDLINLLIKN